MSDDLTIEQLERIIANHESGVQLTGVAVYRQLLAIMQREERLEQALMPFAEPHTMGDNYVKFAPRLIDAARKALSNEVPCTHG